VAVGRIAKVKRLALTHHDPERSDAEIDAIIERLRGQNRSSGLDVFAAAEGQEVRLDGGGAAAACTAASATSDIGAALAECRALVAVATPDKAKMFTDLLTADGVAVSEVAIERAETVADQIHPSVVLLEGSDSVDVAALADRLRHCCGVDTPVVLITSREDHRLIPSSGLADTLFEPVKPSYARAHSCRDHAPRLPLANGKEAGR